jgi:hypothetical protein
LGTEPLLSPVIAIATHTDHGEGYWRKSGLISLRWRSRPVDHRLGELQKVVDIGEIRSQPDRNTERPLLVTVNDVEKLLICQSLFIAKYWGQIFAHQAKGDLAHTGIAKTAAAQRDATLVGLLSDIWSAREPSPHQSLRDTSARFPLQAA